MAPAGFVRCTHPDTDGVADLPVDALGFYKSRGWIPVAADEPAAAAEPDTPRRRGGRHTPTPEV